MGVRLTIVILVLIYFLIAMMITYDYQKKIKTPNDADVFVSLFIGFFWLLLGVFMLLYLVFVEGPRWLKHYRDVRTIKRYEKMLSRKGRTKKDE